MKRTITKYTHQLALCFSLILSGCSQPATDNQSVSNEVTKGLKDYYKDYFPIGVSVSTYALKDSANSTLIKHQFNSMTPENDMKMEPIHPEQNTYNWKSADAIVAFAQENHIKMRGHALVWHQQYPDWFFVDEKGNQISKDTLYSRMKAHINAVVTRYKDDIYAWDVVNEAVSDNKDLVYREESPYYQIAGEEYLAKAFEYAHEADPEAKLFYNDYNAAMPEKVDRIYQLVKKLVDAGVPINGVGIQGHWSIFGPSEEDLRYAIDKYSSLGLDVQITELDVSIYPWEKNRRSMREGESDEFTPELQQKQAEKYKMFFKVFRDYKDVITGITFWNISDQHTWLDEYPVAGRKNYPLLFDENLKPKKAYHEVVDFEEK